MPDKNVIDVVDDIAYRDFLYAYVKYLENSINPKEYIPREEVIKAHVVRDARLAKVYKVTANQIYHIRSKVHNLDRYNAQKRKDMSVYTSKGYCSDKRLRHWTQEELDMIMHSDCTDIELSHRMGRTINAIQSRRSLLKAANSK